MSSKNNDRKKNLNKIYRENIPTEKNSMIMKKKSSKKIKKLKYDFFQNLLIFSWKPMKTKNNFWFEQESLKTKKKWWQKKNYQKLICWNCVFNYLTT